MRLNVGVGTHRAPDPWVNVDVVYLPEINIIPDVIASLVDLPCQDGEVTHLYAGHVLEHLSLQDGTFSTAMQEISRVLGSAGTALFVCPDVYRAMEWWKAGSADWHLVDACLEGPDDGIDPASAWDGCFHAWNCHQQRLLGLVRQTFPEAVAVPMDSQVLQNWPVVSQVSWQCAVLTKTS